MKFYYYDDSYYIVMGPYNSVEEAKEAVQADVPHTRTAKILQFHSVSRPPTLKRTWR